MSAKRLLVLTTSFPAVSETFVVDHVVGMAIRGWDVTVACREVDRAAVERIRATRGVDIDALVMEKKDTWGKLRRALAAAWHCGAVRLPAVGSPTVRAAAEWADPFSGIVRRTQPEVIHAHFGPNGILAALAPAARRIPLIVDFHGYDVTSLSAAEGWSAYRWLLGKARAVVHSSFVEERVRRRLGIEVAKIPLGVDNRTFRAPRRSTAWPCPLRLLTVGRLVFQKGHHLAIEALAVLRQQYPDLDACLRICGAGPLEATLRTIARMLRLERYVEFGGALSHEGVAGEMRNADVLLVPSLRVASGSDEAFCRVAVEGLSSGLAVVGTPTGGLPETIGAGGVLAEEASASALAGAVRLVLEKFTPESIGSIAVARASQFPIDAMWNGYDLVARTAIAA